MGMGVVLSLMIVALALILAKPARYATHILDVPHATASVIKDFSRMNGPAVSPAAGPNDLHIDILFSGGNSEPAAPFDRYENLMQTDSFDRGVRIELSPPRRLAIVYPPSSNSVRGVILTEQLSLEIPHHVHLDFTGDGIRASLDGKLVADLQRAPFVISLANIRAGVGYNHERRFSGSVDELTITYTGSHVLRPLVRSAVVVALFASITVLFCALIARSFAVRAQGDLLAFVGEPTS